MSNTNNKCRLCGRDNVSSAIQAESGRVFCSTGCRDVHNAFGANELKEHNRTEPDQDSEMGLDTSDDPHDDADDGLTRIFFRVDGMYSATCEAFLESVASKHDGVTGAEASYITETIGITYDPEAVTETDLQEALSTLGYTAVPRESTTDESDQSTTDHTERTTGMQKRPDGQILEFRYAVGMLFGAFLLLPYAALIYPVHLAAMVNWAPLRIFEGAFNLTGTGAFFFLRLYLVLTGIIVFFTGLPVLRGAYISVKMRRPNTDLLVAITAISAYVYSTLAVILGRNDVFFDLTIITAAVVTAAAFYESSVKQRALSRLTDLTVSQVSDARRYHDDGTTEQVPVENLAAGDRILVRQGERIPVDGELLDGTCTVDEAVVTGESLPVLKQAGDEVVGGSIVTDDAALVRTDTNATSSIDRLRTAVWDLQSADHGVQRHADQLTARVVGVVGGVALVAGFAGIALGSGVSGGLLLFLLAFLVGSPWALGLATPLSVATSLEEALQRGIVVFDETVFERLRGVDIVVFDKTGTLTTGEMDVIEADAPTELLEMVATLEDRASHPAATAIADAFTGEGDRAIQSDGGVSETHGQPEPNRVTEFTTHRSGVEGVIDDQEVLVGNLDLFEEQGWAVSPDIESRVNDARGFGRLPVIVGRDGVAEGLIIVGDEPRSGWDEMLTRLGADGTEVVILTGDDKEAADFFSGHDAVKHVFAAVPPAGKTETIQRLKSQGKVAMVGDGTNDAPAIAAADLGITLGSGTALAADAADIAIADDTISSVELAFDIATAARQRVRQNNGLALVYNVLAVGAAVAGLFNPLTAVLAVAISAGLIGANSSRQLVDD
jgi:heavy metal translocating P-type ATPase